MTSEQIETARHAALEHAGEVWAVELTPWACLSRDLAVFEAAVRADVDTDVLALVEADRKLHEWINANNRLVPDEAFEAYDALAKFVHLP